MRLNSCEAISYVCHLKYDAFRLLHLLFRLLYLYATYILLELENDLEEVETSFVFIVGIYYQIIIIIIIMMMIIVVNFIEHFFIQIARIIKKYIYMLSLCSNISKTSLAGRKENIY